MRAFRAAKNALGQAAATQRGGPSTVMTTNVGDHGTNHRYSHQLSGKAAKKVALGTKLNRKNLDKLGKSAADNEM